MIAPRIMSTAPSTGASRRPRLFAGWWVVIGAIGVNTLASLLIMQAFGAYFVHFQEEFGWRKATVAGAFSMGQIITGVISPFQGRLVDRLGARVMATIGVAVLSGGVVGLSFVQDLPQLYTAFFFIFLGAAQCGWVTLNTAAAHWFRRRRAMVLGLVGLGSSFGGLLLPVVAWSLDTFGWRETAFGSGLVLLVVGVPLARMVRDRPEKYGLTPDGEALPMEAGQAAGEQADEGDFTLKEAMRTSAFWYIAIGHGSASLIIATVSVHLISHLVERVHMSVEMASVMVALMTAFTICGQLCGGYLATKAESRVLAAVGMAGQILGMLALAFATNVAWVVAFALVYGVSWGVRGPVMSSIRAEYFGRAAFGAILGVSMMLLAIGNVFAPLLAGYMADRTGSYQLAFVVMGVLGGVGSMFFLLAKRPTRPARRPV